MEEVYSLSVHTYADSDTFSMASANTCTTIHGTGALAATGLEYIGRAVLTGLDLLAMTRKLAKARSIIPHIDTQRIIPLNVLDDMYADLFEMVIRHRSYPSRFGIEAGELLLTQMRWRNHAHCRRLLAHLSAWPTYDIVVFLANWPPDCRSAVRFDGSGVVLLAHTASFYEGSDTIRGKEDVLNWMDNMLQEDDRKYLLPKRNKLISDITATIINSKKLVLHPLQPPPRLSISQRYCLQ